MKEQLSIFIFIAISMAVIHLILLTIIISYE